MKKGQEWIGGIFSILLVVVIAGFALPTVNLTQATKVSQDVEAKEFENKAILIANSLMSDPTLVYFDSNSMSYQRGVLDKVKLDFIRNSIASDLIPATLFYSGTYTRVNINDKEDGTPWEFSLSDKDDATIQQYLRCINQPETPNPIEMCHPKRASTILDKGFPVAIVYPNNDVHMGLLKLTVFE